MDFEELKAYQQEVVKQALLPSTDIHEVELATDLLSVINDYSVEEVRSALGIYGDALQRFAREIDITHPGLAALLNGELVSRTEGRFSRDALDLLKLASYAINWNLSQHVVHHLKRVISQHECFHEISREIDAPSRNQLHVRFVPDRVERDKIRSTKKVQEVDLRILFKKGTAFWNAQPSNFGNFVRHQNRYLRELGLAKGRCQHFENLGLTSMSEEIRSSITLLERKSRKENYLDFNRITLTQAAVIIAKIIGCRYNDGNHTVSIDEDQFDYKFKPDFPFGPRSINYQPRAYSLHELWNCASNEMIELVNHMESMPELGHRAAFDHYRVLVGGFDYPEDLDDNRSLDLLLLQNKFTTAILVGEKDGEFFFISHWM